MIDSIVMMMITMMMMMISLARSYDAMIGLTVRDWVHELGDKPLNAGLTQQERYHLVCTYLPHTYSYIKMKLGM